LSVTEQDAHLQLAFDGPVATIAFNRPQARNALTGAMLQGLVAALDECSAREDLRVVVLRGAGELAFSAGYNLDELPSHPLSAADASAIHAPVRRAAQAIVHCRHPVLAAARRFVIGAGLDLFSHADMRVCAEGTGFVMPPNKYGFIYPMEGLAALAQAAGAARAADMLLSAQPLSSEQALGCGLVHRVLKPEAFEAELAALAQTLAANAPLSMRATKQALRSLQALQSSDDAFYQRIAACLNSEDCREAMAAFKDKRTPVFTGS
jgi:enoyl-CoA hydratase/carnithine racemase